MLLLRSHALVAHQRDDVLVENLALAVGQFLEAGKGGVDFDLALELDAQLLQQLFSVRNAIAAKEGLARNRIFTDEQLQEMAFWRPKTKLELKRIRGIGPKKVDRYGEAIVKCIWGDRI